MKMNNNTEKQRQIVIVTSCESVRSGQSTKDGRTFPWTMYKVLAVLMPGQQSRAFTSFEDFSSRKDTEIEVEIEKKIKEKDGQVYEDYYLSTPKRSVWEAIRQLEDRLDELEARLALGRESPKAEPGAPERDVEKLPF